MCRLIIATSLPVPHAARHLLDPLARHLAGHLGAANRASGGQEGIVPALSQRALPMASGSQGEGHRVTGVTKVTGWRGGPP